MNRPRRVAALAGLALVALPVTLAGAAAPPDLGTLEPSTVQLEQRASLSADFLADSIPTGALSSPGNGRTPPYAGHVIPGFSGVLVNADGTFWGMPDNGFGSKGNSTDFLLRLYHVTPSWETSGGGAGSIGVDSWISLRDPDHLIGFPIVNESTTDRLLTGGDLDIESIQRTPDGTFWIGEEFGPFILHFDATGRLLSAPIQPPFGKSPANPFLGTETPRVRSSRGFEAMALSPDGTKLYPVVEGYFADDSDQLRRYIYEVDVATGTYTGTSWQLHTEAPENVIGDAQAIDDHRLLIIERDDLQGSASQYKRLYVLDLDNADASGFVSKHLAVDLLSIQNPTDIGAGSPAGGYGLGTTFSFPLQSVESVAVLPDGRILVANDNNYPGSNGRVAGAPDDTEMIVLGVVDGPEPVVPEVPLAILLPVFAGAVLGAGTLLGRRRSGASLA